jgi:hypothetical protein
VHEQASKPITLEPAVATGTVSSRAWNALLHVEVDYALSMAGVHAVLLKGLATEIVLGDPSRSASVDVDVLVPPSHLNDAITCLAGRGFGPERPGIEPGEMAPWSADLVRSTAGGSDRVDVHRYLPGLGVHAQTAFDVMSRETEPVAVAGRNVHLPTRRLTGLVIVLHAARSLSHTKPRQDLVRLEESLTEHEWYELRALADTLDALPALRAGLETEPVTRHHVDELGLDGVCVPLHLRLASQPVDRVALQIAEASTLPLSRRAQYLARAAWPSAPKLRLMYPSRTDNAVGLVGAYILRTADLLRRTPRALRQLWRAGGQP